MLRMGFSGTIAVVYPYPLRRPFEDPAAASFLGGVADACAEKGLALLLLQGGEESLKIIRTAAVDGLIVFSMPKDDVTLRTFITPQLTTIHQPMAEKGRLAVASLMRENGPLRIIVPTKLIIRQSSDPSTLGSAQETEIDVRSSPGPGSGQKKNVAMKIARTPPRRVAAIADG